MRASVFIILAIVFSCNCCYAGNQADLFNFDFGKVRQGEVLRHTFTLRNDSSKVLNIKDINTSCGCTASKISKKKLAPKESTTIEVVFNTKGYSGIVTQFIYVNTDNLDNPIIRFTIKTEVKK